MAESRKVVKVFLASPGDLQEERRVARRVTESFNQLWSARTGYHVELVGWEDTVSTFGRPQAIINRDLDACELFIGLLWRRWGTPPDSDGPFTSGVEEEFERSLAKRQETGKPEMSLFFKEVDNELLRDPGTELTKVRAFQQKIIERRVVLFETFDSSDAFADKMLRRITSYVQSLPTRDDPRDADRTTVADEQDSSTANQTPGTTPFSRAGARFVRELLTKSEGDLQADPLTGLEVARFRLLGTIIRTSGNDEASLGVHDANRFFAARTHINLSDGEHFALLATELEHYSSESVPMWHWLAAIDGFGARRALPIHAIVGAD
jgi:hypothetical protein